MKRVSIVTSLIFLAGLALCITGLKSKGMKAENREAFILYGILICGIAVTWLTIHGLYVVIRRSREVD